MIKPNFGIILPQNKFLRIEVEAVAEQSWTSIKTIGKCSELTIVV